MKLDPQYINALVGTRVKIYAHFFTRAITFIRPKQPSEAREKERETEREREREIERETSVELEVY